MLMVNVGVFSATMELVPLLCLCLLTLSGSTFADENGAPIIIEEGNDAILPCSLSTKENIVQKLFDWKKDGQMEVFLYDAGVHYNNGREGQDEQFKGRVSHFPEQLEFGNASIVIRNTKVTDSGNYTCDFPRLQPGQISYMKLVVRSSSKPSLVILHETKDGMLLQCEVLGAYPKPKLHWQNRAGNIVPAEEPQIKKRRGSYDITLLTTVIKTDYYRCVATQEEIKHQVYTETYVPVHGKGTQAHLTQLLFYGLLVMIYVLSHM